MTFPGIPCGFSGSMLIFWKVKYITRGLTWDANDRWLRFVAQNKRRFRQQWGNVASNCTKERKYVNKWFETCLHLFLLFGYVWIIPVFELAIYTWSILKLVTMGKQLPLGRPSRRPRYGSRAALGCARYPVWKLRGSAGRMVHWLVSRGYLAAILMKILLDILSKWVKVFDPTKFGRRTAELVVSWD